MENAMKTNKRFVNICLPLFFLILIMTGLSGCGAMIAAMEPKPEEEGILHGYPPPMLLLDSVP